MKHSPEKEASVSTSHRDKSEKEPEQRCQCSLGNRAEPHISPPLHLPRTRCWETARVCFLGGCEFQQAEGGWVEWEVGEGSETNFTLATLRFQDHNMEDNVYLLSSLKLLIWGEETMGFYCPVTDLLDCVKKQLGKAALKWLWRLSHRSVIWAHYAQFISPTWKSQAQTEQHLSTWNPSICGNCAWLFVCVCQGADVLHLI